MTVEEYAKVVKEAYEAHLAKHDPNSPEAVRWTGKQKPWLRFEILSKIGDLTHKRILDFGCGNGLFLDFLKEKKIECEYHGWDISENMVRIASERHPEGNFRVVNILEDDLANFIQFFDYVIVSGVFNWKLSGKNLHVKWMQAILLKIWDLCKEGLAVNFLTEHVEWRDKALFYSSIEDVVSFCVGSLSRWFTLRQDYQLWEFTLWVCREPTVKLRRAFHCNNSQQS